MPHKHITGGQETICIFMSSLTQLTVASFPSASLRDGGHGTIGNSTSKYSAFMNEAALGLNGPLCGLGVQWSESERTLP